MDDWLEVLGAILAGAAMICLQLFLWLFPIYCAFWMLRWMGCV